MGKKALVSAINTIATANALKIPLALQDKVTEKLKLMIKKGILEPVQDESQLLHHCCGREGKMEK